MIHIIFNSPTCKHTKMGIYEISDMIKVREKEREGGRLPGWRRGMLHGRAVARPRGVHAYGVYGHERN